MSPAHEVGPCPPIGPTHGPAHGPMAWPTLLAVVSKRTGVRFLTLWGRVSRGGGPANDEIDQRNISLLVEASCVCTQAISCVAQEMFCVHTRPRSCDEATASVFGLGRLPCGLGRLMEPWGI